MLKKDKEYEIFVQKIQGYLLRLDGLTNVDVKHDVRLKGISGQKHQIDVYWEYTLGGVTHRVAIECKHHNRKIGIGLARNFFGVLSDIPNLRGVMASKKGFQKGVEKFAGVHKIDLWVVKEAEKAIVPLPVINFIFPGPVVEVSWENLVIMTDFEWYTSSGFSERSDQFQFTPSGTTIENRKTGEIKSLTEIQESILASDMKIGEERIYIIPEEDKFFENGWLHSLGNESVKIWQIKMPYVIKKGQIKAVFVRDASSDYALVQNVITKDFTIFDESGNFTARRRTEGNLND